MSAHITPSKINFHRQSQILAIEIAGVSYRLSAEYLRQFSPSAEVRGHGQQAIQFLPGKSTVKIKHLSPVGQYAIKIIFDDGHNSGIYSWEFLQELGESFKENWQHYQQQLDDRGLSRFSEGRFKAAD